MLAEISKVAVPFTPKISVPLPSAASTEPDAKESFAFPSLSVFSVIVMIVFFPVSGVVLPPSKLTVPALFEDAGSTAQSENAELLFDTLVTERSSLSKLIVAFAELNLSGESTLTEIVNVFPTPYSPLEGVNIKDAGPVFAVLEAVLDAVLDAVCAAVSEGSAKSANTPNAIN
jgi:hypothetical protein